MTTTQALISTDMIAGLLIADLENDFNTWRDLNDVLLYDSVEDFAARHIDDCVIMPYSFFSWMDRPEKAALRTILKEDRATLITEVTRYLNIKLWSN